jgi:two-component system response regulator HupR/HoxA
VNYHFGSKEELFQAVLTRRLDAMNLERIELLEARILKETLVRHRWNKTRAAQELGLSRVGLRSKLARYRLEQG